MNVTIFVCWFRWAHAYGLMPTVHSRNRIGMNGESQVLMNSDVVPPDTQSVGITRFVRSGAAFAFQSPLIAFVIQSYRGHHLFLSVLVRLPTAHVMTARDDARFNSFSDPGANDEISNLSFDAHQIAGSHAQLRGMARMQPERI